MTPSNIFLSKKLCNSLVIEREYSSHLIVGSIALCVFLVQNKILLLRYQRHFYTLYLFQFQIDSTVLLFFKPSCSTLYVLSYFIYRQEHTVFLSPTKYENKHIHIRSLEYQIGSSIETWSCNTDAAKLCARAFFFLFLYKTEVFANSFYWGEGTLGQGLPHRILIWISR